MDRFASYPRNMGFGIGEISERRCLVLLSILATQVPLRCARIRYQSGWEVCVDSLRGGRCWLPARWWILELPCAAPRAPRRCAKDCAWVERGCYAVRFSCPARSRLMGPGPVQRCVFRTAVLVDTGHGLAS